MTSAASSRSSMVEQRSTVSPWMTTDRSRCMSFHQAVTSAWNDPSISSTISRPSGITHTQSR